MIGVTFEAMERRARRSGLVCDTREALYLGLEVPRSFVLDEMTREEAAQPLALASFFPAFWRRSVASQRRNLAPIGERGRLRPAPIRGILVR